MKTRKKEIDIHKLLGISSRSKKITKNTQRKQLRRSNENASRSSDVSDKENESNQKSLAVIALSPLKSQDVRHQLKPLSSRNVSVLSPLSVSKANPEATSTPNVVRRTLFPDVAPKESKVNQVIVDSIVLSDDSDCTDDELEIVKDPQSTENPTKKSPVKRKRVRKQQNVDKIVDQITSKRVIRPTFKAINSPMHRKFFATPRNVPDDDTNVVKLAKKGTLVVNVPSRLALTKEVDSQNVEKVKTKANKGQKLQKSKIPVKKLDDDAKKMPAPPIPVKKKVAKRAVRLYSEPKPVPKNLEVVPKYRQELQRRNLRRQGSAAGDDDIYNFHPSQEIVDEPKEDDSYIKNLIQRLKKRKKPGRKKKVDKATEPAQVEKQPNRMEIAVEKIRQRITEKQPTRSSLRKSVNDPNMSKSHEKSVHFHDIPEVVSFETENVPLAKSPSMQNMQNKSFSVSRDISMLPPITSPSPNRVIRDPVPGTSTGGWTSQTHSTPNPRINHRISLNSSINRSSFNRSRENVPINSSNSPWRVNEDRVPRTKYFSLSNKDLLPTYSSDIIDHDPIPFVPDRSNEVLNNSDAENAGPRRTLRARKTHGDRIPLAPLEIREIPQEKHQPTTESPLVRHSLTQKDVQNQAHRPQIQIISDIPVGNRYRLSGDRLVLQPQENPDFFSDDSNMSVTSNVSDCFGFDASCVDDELPDEEFTQTNLKEKLKELKKIFPLEKSVSHEVEMPVLFKSPVKQTNTLKTYLEANTPKQPKKSSEKTERPSETSFVQDSSDDSDIEVTDISSNKVSDVNEQHPEISVKLFDDPEDLRVKQAPVTKRRSYAGRQKRKRVQFSDYETSASELDDDDDEIHEKRRRKRNKPDVEKSEEFQQFVSEFNSMCDEVDKYELVVEPIEK